MEKVNKKSIAKVTYNNSIVTIIGDDFEIRARISAGQVSQMYFSGNPIEAEIAFSVTIPKSEPKIIEEIPPTEEIIKEPEFSNNTTQSSESSIINDSTGILEGPTEKTEEIIKDSSVQENVFDDFDEIPVRYSPKKKKEWRGDPTEGGPFSTN